MFDAITADDRDHLNTFLLAGNLQFDATRNAHVGGLWGGIWRRLTGPALA